MHSFHQSRGRIAFEVLCTMTVSASCAAAWMQTGATAFLPAAFATGVYGLWHLIDMRRPVETVPVAKEAPPETQQQVPVPEQGPVPEPVAASGPEEPPKPKKRSRKKRPEAEAVVAPVPEVSPGFPNRAAIEEELHAPIAPLFEPKPFPLQLRPRFGRKAG